MQVITTKQYTQKIFALVAMVLVVSVSAPFTARVAEAAPNAQINYQGKLTTASNVAVADGTYNMQFWLIASSTAATSTAVWSESHTSSNRVQVTNGLFSVMLGSVSSLAGVDFNQTLYLGVEIGGTDGTPAWDGEMSPRKVLGTVPAAFQADNLDGLDSTQFVRTDATSTIATSSAETVLSIIQNGVGDILNLFDGASEVFSVIDGGNVGIGSTTPSSKLTVSGNGYFGGNLTATGTLAVTGAATLSSTLNVTGNTTLTNASTTNLTVSTNSYLGTVQSGTWNGATIGVPYGGTGATSLTGILVGNGTSAFTSTTTVAQGYGGTGIASYSAGDILYADATGKITKLNVGSTGEVLKVAGGVPTWGVDLTSGGGGGGGVWATSTGFIYPQDPANTVVIGDNATATANSIFEVIGNAYFSNNVGIGDTSPLSLFTVGDGDAFQVTAAGTVASGTWNGTAIDVSDYTNLGVTATGLELSGDDIVLTSGYSIPLTASTTEWAAAYASTTALTPAYMRGLFSNSATGLTYNSTTGETSLSAGYVIPLSASTTEWSSFFNTPSTRITAGTNLSWSGNTLNGTFGTSSARASLSETVTGLDYDSGTGILSLTSGYVIPLTASTTEWANASAQSHAAVTLAGSYDYLSLSGQEITLNQIDLTTDVTGVLPDANVADDITLTNITQITNRSILDTTGTLTVARGGTGATSLTGLLLGNGTSAFTATTTLSAAYIEDKFLRNDGDTASGDYDFSSGTLFVDDSEGRVGIGIGAPGSKLSVYDTNSSDIIADFGNAGGYGSLYVYSGTGSVELGTSPSFGYIGTGTNTPLVFRTNYEEKMRLSAEGNVGIGSTTPSSKLTVSGNAYIGGNVTATGTLAVTGAATLSSTLGVTGHSTLTTASSTNLTVSTNSYLGTVQSGTWNGATIGEIYGGTGQTSYATGDILYASGSNTLAKRTIGSTGNVLTVSSGVPTWAATSSLGLGNGTFLGLSDTISSYNSGRILFESGSAVTDSANFTFDTSNNRLVVTNASTTNITNSGNSYLGTVQSGTWNGSTIGVPYGGTGATSLTGLLLGNGTSAFTATSTLSAAYIEDKFLRNDGDTASGDYTFDSGTLFVDASNNRVGIGTTTPASNLHIQATSYPNIRLSSDDALAGIRYIVSGYDDYHVYNNYGSFEVYNLSDGGTNFSVKEDGSVWLGGSSPGVFNPTLAADTGGNVGIGSTTPSSKLTVSGNGYFGGNLTATGTLAVTGAATLSSTLNVTGNTTLTNASSTNLTVSTNSYLGTVQSGTWNGATIGVPYGGTGATSLTGLLLGNGTSAFTATTTLSASYLEAAVILSSEIDTYSELDTIVADVTLTHNGLIDTSSEIAAIVGDETGTGSLVFSASPTFTGNTTLANASTTNLTVSGNSYLGTAEATSLRLTGAFYDSTNSEGTQGMVLQSTGTSTRWVATTTLGIVSSQWGQSGSDIYYAAGNVSVGTTTATEALTVDGNLAFLSNAFMLIPGNSSNAFKIATSTTGTPLFSIDTTAGSEEVTIGLPGGDVVIGDVGAGTNLVFEESSTIHGQGENTLTFGTAGDIINFAVNVGIGSTSPSHKLTVSGNGYFGGNLTATGTLAISGHSTLTTASSTNLTVSGNTYISTLINSGDTITDFTGTGLTVSSGALTVSTSTLGLDTEFFKQGGNSFGATAVLGTNDSNNLAFETNGTTRITIASTTGYVGIGTAAPQVGLHVVGASGAANSIIVGDDSNGGYLNFGTTEGYNALQYGGGEFSIKVSQPNGLRFYTNADSDSTAEMIITDDGNVGIGTTTPDHKFVVDGGNAAFKTTSQDNQLHFHVGTAGYSSISALNASGNNIKNLVLQEYGGNVGIGTTSPADLLHVSGRIRSGVAGGTTGSLNLASSNGVNWIFNTSDGSNLDVTTNAGSATNFTISGPSGVKVGIGSTTPSETLTVSGNGYFGGNLTATGTLAISGHSTLTTASSTNLTVSTNSYLGTVQSGTWNGATIGVPYGGTGATSLTGLLLGNGTSAFTATSTLSASYLEAAVILSSEIDTCSELAAILSGQTTGACGSVVLSNGPTFTGNTTLANASSTNFTVTGNAYVPATITMGTNTFVRSGAHNLTLTTTGTTNATIPSGTITLADLSSTQTFSGAKTFSNATVTFSANTATLSFSSGTGNKTISTGGSTNLILSPGGNVGIASTSPSSKLTVGGSAWIGGNLTATGTLAVTGAATLSSTLNVTGNTTLTTASSTNLTVSTNSYLGTVQSGTWNGATIGVPYGGTGATSLTGLLLGNGTSAFTATSTLSAAYIEDKFLRNDGDTGVGTYNITGTLGVTGTTTLATSGGRVGIGTSDPSAKLEVAGGIIQVTNGSDITYVNGNGVLVYPATVAYIGTGNSTALNLETNSTTHATLDTNGRFGIGTTTPSARLQVTGSAGSDDIFAISSSTNSRLFTITAAGNVGIGDADPDNLLEIAGTDQIGMQLTTSHTTGTAINLTNSSSGGNFQIEVTGSGNGYGSGHLVFWNNGLGGQAPLIFNSNGNVRVGHDAGYSSTAASMLSVAGNAAIGANYIGTAAPSNGLLVEGNVGIGSTSPSHKLTVSGNGYFGGNLTATGTLAISGHSTLTTASSTNLTVSGNTYISTLINSGDTITDFTGTGLTVSSGALTVSTSTLGLDTEFFKQGGNSFGATAVLGTNDSNNLAFETNGTTRITIASTTGYVGIGTSSPANRLSVALGSNEIAQLNDEYNASGIWGMNIGLLSQNNEAQIVSRGNAAITFSTSGTLNSMTAGTEHMRITDGGNVGIGTTTPSSRLHVRDVTTDNVAAAMINHGPSLGTGAAYRDAFLVGEGTQSGDMVLAMWTDGSNNRAYIQAVTYTNSYEVPLNLQANGGNVGIGTTSPIGTLHVQKDTDGVSGSYFVNQNSGTSAYAEISVLNNGSSRTNGVNLITTGTGWSTSGGYVQDGAQLAAGAGLSGGLSLITEASAPIRFYTNGGTSDASQRMIITSAGNVGIGTTTPSARLHITGTAGSDDIFAISSSTNSRLLTVTAAGRVGIGTSTPNAHFQVADLSSSPSIEVLSADGGTGYLKLLEYDGSFGEYGGYLAQNGGSDIFEIGYLAGASYNGAIYLTQSNPGDVSIGTTSFNGARLAIQTSGTDDILNLFETGGTEVFTVLENGNVGIGTSSPSAKLDVWGADTSSGSLALNVNNSAGSRGLGVYNDGRVYTRYLTVNTNSSTSWINVNSNDSSPIFSGLSSGTEVVRITSSGSVGIGTTSPANPLTVQTATSNYGLEHTDGAVRLGTYVGGSTGGGWLGTISNHSFSFFVNGGSPSMLIDTSGNVGIGTTTPSRTLTVAGSARFTGAFYDASNASGTLGMVLQSTGTSTRWVATSTLGITGGGGSSLWTQNGSDIYYNTGNVGIGTTTPGALLDLGAATDNSKILLYNDGAYQHGLGIQSGQFRFHIAQASDRFSFLSSPTGTEVFTIQGSGNVGIGTTTPSSLLTVAGDLSVGTTSLVLSGSFSNRGILGLANPDDDIQVGETVGGLAFISNESSVSSPVPTNDIVAQITAVAAAQHTSGFWPTDLTFSTVDGSNALTERMRILQGGNVGIGTSTPLGNFHVVGASSIFGSDGGDPGIFIHKGDVNQGGGQDEFWGFVSTGAGADNRLIIGTDTNASGIPNNEALTVLIGGNVGIGTSTPGRMLSVAGDVALTGTFNFATTSGGVIARLNDNAFITGGTASTYNTGLGQLTLSDITTGGYNTALGYGSLENATSTTGNTAVGALALSAPVNTGGGTAGYFNTAIGYSAMSGSISSSKGLGNIAIGASAGTYGVDGDKNILIGYFAQAGSTNNLTGSNNILIGGQGATGVRLPSDSASNQLNIQNIIFGINNSGSGSSVSTGNIGIGSTTPSHKLTVAGDTNITGALRFNGLSGTAGYVLQSNGSNAPTWVATSSLGLASTFLGLSDTPSSYTAGSVLFTSGSAVTEDNGTFYWDNTSKRLAIGHNSFSGLPSGTDLAVISSTTATARLTVANTNGTDVIGIFDARNDGTAQLQFGSASEHPIAFFANNAQVVTILSGGNVGIGTSTPGQTLTVAGSARFTGAFYDASNASGTLGMVLQSTGTSTRWVATSTLGITGGGGSSLWTQNGSDIYYNTGNVGIGTTSPEAKFHLVNESGQIAFFDQYGGAANTRWRRANGTVGSPSAILTDDVIGNFGFGGYDGTAFSNSAAAVKVTAAENWSDSAWGVNMGFFTTATGSISQVERLTILANGQVGVGTTTPNKRLTVFDTVADAQFRLAYDDSRYAHFQVDSVGDLLITSYGKDVRLTDDNFWVCESGSCPSVTASSTAGYVIAENGYYFGNGMKIDQVSGTTTEIAVYNASGTPIVIFDQ